MGVGRGSVPDHLRPEGWWDFINDLLKRLSRIVAKRSWGLVRCPQCCADIRGTDGHADVRLLLERFQWPVRFAAARGKLRPMSFPIAGEPWVSAEEVNKGLQVLEELQAGTWALHETACVAFQFLDACSKYGEGGRNVAAVVSGLPDYIPPTNLGPNAAAAMIGKRVLPFSGECAAAASGATLVVRHRSLLQPPVNPSWYEPAKTEHVLSTADRKLGQRNGHALSTADRERGQRNGHALTAADRCKGLRIRMQRLEQQRSDST